MIPAFLWKWIGVGLVTLGLIASTFYYKHEYNKYFGYATEMLVAAKQASQNQKLTYANAPAQILYIGDSNRQLRMSIDTQNQAIADMAAEAIRLKANQKELKQIVDQAIKQREVATKKLTQMINRPESEKKPYVDLCKDAEDALDLIYENE